MNDCELSGRHCELAGKTRQGPQKSAVRPDGGVVTQRTANPRSSGRIADKFARFTLRSPHGFVRVRTATANFYPCGAEHQMAPARLPASESQPKALEVPVARRIRKSIPRVKQTQFAPIAPYLANLEMIERFWSKVSKAGANDCWLWTASANHNGYGRFKVASFQTRHANRVAWAIANDRDPAELLVRHSCDNPPCCNPAHLLIGTAFDNMRDKSERGRCSNGHRSGESNPCARLTAEQVGKIVRDFRYGYSNMSIAKRFPVGHALISRIRTGRSWQLVAAEHGWQPAIDHLNRLNAQVSA